MTQINSLGYGHNDFEIVDVIENDSNVLYPCLGHNAFNEIDEQPHRISRSLLSLVYKVDKARLFFGIVDNGSGKRPVVFINGDFSYIDLLSGRLTEMSHPETEEKATVSYYGGTFKFLGEEGSIAFIDQEILFKNFGYGIVVN